MTCKACNGLGRIHDLSADRVYPCPTCSQPLPETQRGAARDQGNVRILPCVTRLDVPVERILAVAGDADLKLCIIVGEEQDGSLYFASNKASGPEVLWALERAKLALLEAGGAA